MVISSHLFRYQFTETRELILSWLSVISRPNAVWKITVHCMLNMLCYCGLTHGPLDKIATKFCRRNVPRYVHEQEMLLQFKINWTLSHGIKFEDFSVVSQDKLVGKLMLMISDAMKHMWCTGNVSCMIHAYAYYLLISVISDLFTCVWISCALIYMYASHKTYLRASYITTFTSGNTWNIQSTYQFWSNE